MNLIASVPATVFGMDTTLLALVLASVILLVALLVGWVVAWSRRVAEERAGPFLIFPVTSGPAADRAEPVEVEGLAPEGQSGEGTTSMPEPGSPVETARREPAPREPATPQESALFPEAPAAPRPAPPAPVTPPESAPGSEPLRERPAARLDRDDPFVRPTRGPSHGLRVVTARGDAGGSQRVAGGDTGNLAPALQGRPAPDGTLQLLPGRLVPAAGVGQEIRFVRVPGSNEFTLGRSSGPAHTHIQLPAPTASRMHACMAFETGGWSIANLSATNPVVVNGSPLPLDAALRLQDGDRLEFGEMAFTFRSR